MSPFRFSCCNVATCCKNGARLRPEISLESFLCQLSALGLIGVDDNGSVIALDDRRHVPDDTIQLWVRDVDSDEYVVAASPLMNDLCQARPLLQVSVRQLVQTTG
jgi:hypothetical protein